MAKSAPGTPWLVTALTIALAALMTGLGFWQLERAAAKRETAERFESASDLVRSADSVRDRETDRYARVEARGRYLGARQILIDNMVRDGRNGFLVITPLRPDDPGEPLLLVNRGWIAQDPARLTLPDVDVAGTGRAIRGRVGSLPVAGIDIAVPAPAANDWPSVRHFPTAADIGAALGEPVRDWVLLLDAAEKDGFVRDWQPRSLTPERHLGYAIQWFALAATLLVLWAMIRVRRVRRRAR